MEYEKIKEWLDLLVEDFKRTNDHAYFNNQIKTCLSRDEVHMHRGIEIVANVMGIELNIEEYWDCRYRFKYSFTYEGIVFFSSARKG